MARYAEIVNGMVANVIELPDAEDYQGPGMVRAILDGERVNPGDAYADGVFTAAIRYAVITPSDFLALFTADELNAAVAAPELGGWWRVYEGLREGVERDSPRTAQALAALVALAILTEQRAAAILAGWPRA